MKYGKLRVIMLEEKSSHGLQPLIDNQNYLLNQLQKVTCNVTNV